MWSLSTIDERDSVSARMHPHQPVPITATSICCTLVPPVSLSRSCSLCTHAAHLDHLGPLGGFDVDIGLEVLRGLAADGDHAALAHARLNLRLGEHLDNRGVQLVDDRPRRA